MNTILLVGDSIIDNSYWHNPAVGTDCTGDVLYELCKKEGYSVMNHAVEETCASDWYCWLYSQSSRSWDINVGANKSPASHYYYNARSYRLKNTYPGCNRVGDAVQFFPDIKPFYIENYRGLTVVVSAIANDLFLNGEWMRFFFNTSSLVERLDGIFRAYHYKYPGCKVVYILPYKPNSLLGIETYGFTGWFIDYKIRSMKSSILELESVDEIIDLTEHFQYPLDYSESGTGIPKITKKGAGKLADLILKVAMRENKC